MPFSNQGKAHAETDAMIRADHVDGNYVCIVLHRARPQKTKMDIKKIKSGKDKVIDTLNRRTIFAESTLANLQMAKRLADDKASNLREAMSVKSERRRTPFAKRKR